MAVRGLGWAREGGDARVGRVRCSWSDMSVAAATSSGGDEGRTGVAGRRLRERGGGGAGFGRCVTTDLYDVGRRICRARLRRRRNQSALPTRNNWSWVGFYLRDSTKGHFSPVYLQPFLESARCRMIYVTEKRRPSPTGTNVQSTVLLSTSRARLARKARGMASRQNFQNLALTCEAWKWTAGRDY
jgi:hypothetical protein